MSAINCKALKQLLLLAWWQHLFPLQSHLLFQPPPHSRPPGHVPNIVVLHSAVMQVSTSRQLSARSKGELSWVVGPLPARAMVLGLTTRFKKVQTAVGLEVHFPPPHAQNRRSCCQCRSKSLAVPLCLLCLALAMTSHYCNLRVDPAILTCM